MKTSAKNLDASSDQEQIKEHIQNWIYVSEDGDTDRYFDFVTDDFVYYGPGEPPIENFDSIRAFLEPFFKDNTFSMPNWETREIIIREDMAIHIWSGIAYIEPKQGGAKVELDRKYLDVYKKDINGEWKCYLNSYNNNN
jgi:ketosteroid isomerase-like protein